ncbi:MAG: 2-hydroxyacid dehydrogenase [Phycisphaeraceae bacterium]|nr:2-hydroxyacid dehydrogenase [Phycisphaeraceae bacterium]
MHKVVITDFIDVQDPLEPERAALDGVADVVALEARDDAELFGRVEDADALITFHYAVITRRLIERLDRCRLIARAGVGYDNVDLVAARERGIPVVNVPDYGTEEVANSAIAMTLSLVRGTHYYCSRMRAGLGDWSYTESTPLRRLRGRVFGVVGLGRIGMAAALRARALGFDVVFYDPYRQDGFDKTLGVRRVDTLEALLARSFVLSIHCDLNDSSRGLIGRDALARMPRDSFVVNTARAGVLDMDAVIEALASGHLAGAGIDVLETEPPVPDDLVVAAWRDPDHPAHHRLILNPHAAFYSVEGLEEMRTKAAAACRAAILGEPLRNVVN